jgi:hypothetical protein
MTAKVQVQQGLGATPGHGRHANSFLALHESNLGLYFLCVFVNGMHATEYGLRSTTCILLVNIWLARRNDLFSTSTGCHRVDNSLFLY